MKKFITILVILSLSKAFSQSPIKKDTTMYKWKGKVLNRKQWDDTLNVYDNKFWDSVRKAPMKK
jgi:hypothetical protein